MLLLLFGGPIPLGPLPGATITTTSTPNPGVTIRTKGAK